MPIYEYTCESCGHDVEVMQKMGEVLKECPVCKKATLKKKISAAGFQLKGSGWYATDFRGNGKKGEGKPGEDKSAAADGPKTEDKPKDDSAKPAAACGSGTCGCH
ncbi:MAG TPA: FmdB family zinc ribbon protein [Acidiferrobacter sp.]|nr:FmdB family zinc ribbon protein [Acidiferrobacter sp.]